MQILNDYSLVHSPGNCITVLQTVKMLAMKYFLVMVLFILQNTVCNAEVHYQKLATTNKVYLKPTSSDGGKVCQNYPCVTLSRLLGENAPYSVNTSNMTIHFLPGTHTVKDIAPTSAVVHNVSNLTLSGSCSNTGDCSPATVKCSKNFSFIFTDVSNLQISNIVFIECGAVVPRKISDYVYNIWLPLQANTRASFQLKHGTKAALAFGNIHSLILRNVTVMKSRGYGILGLNLLGNSTIVNSQFLQNNYQTRFLPHCNNSSLKANNMNVATCEGGNAMFLFYDNIPSCPKTNSTYPHYSLAIYNSTFAHGIDLSTKIHPLQGGASGIIAIMSQRTYYLSVGLHNISLFENSGNLSSGFINDSGIIPSNIQVTESSFHHQKELLVKVGANPKQACFKTTKMNATINFSKCVFSENEMSGLLFQLEFTMLTTDTFSRVFNVQHCQFWGHGRARRHSQSSALQIVARIADDILDFTKLYIEVPNCSFHNNKVTSTGVWVYKSEINLGEWGFALLALLMIKSYSIVHCIRITFKNSRFYNNTLSKPDSVLYISQSLDTEQMFFDNSKDCYTHQHTGALLKVELQNCLFRNNTAQNEIIFVHCIPLARFIITNSTVSDNIGTAIAANKAVVTFKGVNTIANNIGFNGGGFFLDSSYIALAPQSKLFIYNNRAKNCGGGIYGTRYISIKDIWVQSHCDIFNTEANWNVMCAFQFYGWNGTKSELNLSVIMANNKAEIAGDSIYGAPLEHCILADDRKGAQRPHNDGDFFVTLVFNWLIWHKNVVEGNQELFSSVLKIKGNLSQSEITSESYKLCPCFKGIVDCNRYTPRLSVYPGNTFYIPVAAVGQFNGTSPALILTSICEPEIPCFYNPRVSIGMGQRIQVLDRGCSHLVYTINTDLTSVTIHANLLNVSSVYAKLSKSYIINVTVLPCSIGFMLKGSTPKCECMDVLIPTLNIIDCDAESQKVRKIAGTWIAPYEENSSKIFFHEFCPFDYCKLENVLINFSNPDEQCAFNHSGVLCGACKPGLSLALGSSQCLQCPNTYLLLIIPFALAGVGLVLLLLKCNLTVSVGTVNGLIFYANIVRANQAIFFPDGESSSVTTFFSVFIAWINLDLGIETCFFHGMNANLRAWLQFVFPVYIWILVGLMILASRYSILVSRLIGPNAVPVLATLFLLSFAKLLRSIIAAVSFTYLVYPYGTEHAMWLQDGNVELFQHHHSILFLVALLFSVLYIVPLTLLVLLAPCLQAKSGYKLLKWVGKLKPFFDAYQGPYTEKFGYWTGLMLVTRIVLFIVFATNTSGDPGVNLVAILTVVFGLIFLLWNAGRVYKRCFVHMNESFSLLNLGCLASLTLFYKTSNSSATSYRNVSYISAGMAFVNLCIILCYHSLQVFKPLQVCRCVSTAFAALSKHFPTRKHASTSVSSRPAAIEMNVLREPLLSSNSNRQ